MEKLPITIREGELIVGSNTKMPRSCQTFPEYSFEWLEAELDTVATRSADPFYISEDAKRTLKEVAVMLGCSYATVRRHFASLMCTLKEYISDCEIR